MAKETWKTTLPKLLRAGLTAEGGTMLADQDGALLRGVDNKGSAIILLLTVDELEKLLAVARAYVAYLHPEGSAAA